MNTRRKAEKKAGSARAAAVKASLCMFLIPCSCGTTFVVAEDHDHQGTAWSRYLVCPGCGKRHDPKNRLLQMGFHPEFTASVS